LIRNETLQTKNLNIDQLIESCKKADKSAQFELYKRYYKTLYNTAFRILNNSCEAEDVMQESFLSAYSKLGTFKAENTNANSEATFGAWLKRIVINKSLTQLKKINKHEKVPLERIENIKEEDDYSDYSSVKAGEVLKGIQQLKGNYKLVLNLHFIEGYDYEEISEITKWSNQNIRVQIARAKQKLKENLKLKYEQIT